MHSGRRWRRPVSVALGFAWLVSLVVATHALSAPASDAWRLDPTFGDQGEVVTAFGSGFDEIHGVALQPDGKIVAVGETASPTGRSQFVVARYLPDGRPDRGFGDNGSHIYSFFGGDDVAYGVAI